MSYTGHSLPGRLVTVAVRDGIGRLTLARPKARNAVSHSLVDDFERGLASLHEGGHQVAVLAAEPPVFCAGADLRTSEPARAIRPVERLLRLIATSGILWIAEIDGPALGGGVSLVAACPVSVCTENAWFSLPEYDLGLFPDAVYADLVPVIGRRNAMALALSGRQVRANEAKALGLVTAVVSPAELAGVVSGWAANANRSPAAGHTAAAMWNAGYLRAHQTDTGEAGTPSAPSAPSSTA
jgi:enoyl-CoA hydratase/carnithine racemase